LVVVGLSPPAYANRGRQAPPQAPAEVLTPRVLARQPALRLAVRSRARRRSGSWVVHGGSEPCRGRRRRCALKFVDHPRRFLLPKAPELEELLSAAGRFIRTCPHLRQSQSQFPFRSEHFGQPQNSAC